LSDKNKQLLWIVGGLKTNMPEGLCGSKKNAESDLQIELCGINKIKLVQRHYTYFLIYT
jgi:hypothetical protein